MTLPLENIRVLDLTRAAAGPFYTMILADLGANVVKVEPTPRGDMTRLWGPYDHDIGVYYLSINRNKRGMGVDFRNEAGLQTLRRLAARADVVVENFKPGTAEAMGLGYEDVKAANPKVIYALRDLLNARFCTRDAIDWSRELMEAGVPSGPIYTLDNVFADPQVQEQGMVEEIQHPVVGNLKLLSNPMRMDAFDGKTVRMPPPLLGEHNRAVLEEYGFSSEAIDELEASGAVGSEVPEAVTR